jgi:hypothetical protein
MLLHGVAARYGREQLAGFDSVAVHTLAADASTNKTNHVLTVCDDGERCACGRRRRHAGAVALGTGAARVTKDASLGDSLLIVGMYIVDAVLLLEHLRQCMGTIGVHASLCKR